MSIAKKLTAAAAIALTVSGCSLNLSVDTLLSPPKLSDEQTEIYTALTEAAGNVELRYPRMGEHLGAFVVNDFDADGSNEAMVFFERKSSDIDAANQREAGLRIGFLDRDPDGAWHSVYEMAAAGVQVESVEFSPLGSESPKAIITYSALNSQEKLLSVVGYSDNTPHELSQLTVSQYKVADVTGDSSQLLLTFTRPTQTMPAVFSVYGCNEEGSIYQPYAPVTLSRNIAEYDLITTGYYKNPNGRRMFCAAVDYLIAENQYSTELLYFNGNGFVTADSFLFNGSPTSYNRRTNALTPKQNSRDINGDGILDVPMTSVLPGYESLTYPEQMNTIWWFSQISGEINRVVNMYVDPAGSYQFALPNRWEGVVTAEYNADSRTTVFWTTDEKEREAVFTVKTVDSSDTYGQSQIEKDGFTLAGSNDTTQVYIKNIEYQGLSLTQDEIASALTVIPSKGERI